MQPYLLRDCRDAVRQLWVGGWWRERVTETEGEKLRQRERDSCSPHSVNPESILTSRALDPEYIHAGGILPCVGGDGFAVIAESV